MKDSIRRVIMSKRVAARFIESVAEVGRTLTVYFSDDRQMRSFVGNVKTASFGPQVSVCEGFDHVTFMSTDEKAICEISKLAHNAGLDSVDM